MFDPKLRNLVVMLPSVQCYRDRVKMFGVLAQSFASAKIILRQSTDVAEIRQALLDVPFEVVKGRPGSICHKAYLAASTLSIDRSKPTIFQDTFAPAMTVLDSLRCGQHNRGSKHFVSLYYPSTKFFHLSKDDPFWTKLTTIEQRHYRRMYRRRSMDEFLAARFADGIIGNSPEICTSISDAYAYPSEHTCVIPGELDINNYVPVANRQQVRQELGLDASAAILLCVGSVQGRKELDVLLHAVHHLSLTSDLDAHLIVCGSTESAAYAGLRCMANATGIKNQVHFWGRKPPDQLALYYSAADCFVHPGRWEGSPRVIKEALAYGCRVVASDISGSRILDPTGEFIRFFAPGDAIDLAEKIGEAMISGPADCVRQRRFLEESFSPVVVAGQYMDFYQRLIWE
jgi:glycosyltransferase involved in cell wall biosynthesis